MPKRRLSFLLLAATLAPSAAWAFGHGRAPELSDFVRAPTRVEIALLPNAQLPNRDLARYAAGEGRSVVVTLAGQGLGRMAARTHVVERVPGKLLAIFEGHPSLDVSTLLARAEARTVFAEDGARVVSVDARGFALLAAEPRVFVEPIPTRESMRPKVEAPSINSTRARSEPGGPAFEPDARRLEATVRELSGEDDVVIDGGRTRIPDRGNAGPRELAQKLMVDRFLQLGLEARTVCYDKPRYKGCNVEATLWGADRDAVVVFSAHLDSVRNKGADDDGSGSAALLEIARLFAEHAPRKSIRFLAFDQEELGLIGSKAYAEAFARTSPRIEGVFQMDMIGYDADRDSAMHAMDCGRADSIPLTRAVSEANERLGTGLKVIPACTNRSDHASFWAKGVPATIVSENFFGDRATRPDDNRCYHKACDTVELIDFDYMTRIVKVVANAGWAFQDTLP
jgi:hypothetical protein